MKKKKESRIKKIENISSYIFAFGFTGLAIIRYIETKSTLFLIALIILGVISAGILFFELLPQLYKKITNKK